MPRPVISVLVTTCNQHAYIRQCLESVLLQVVDADLQILVGDDCSEDGTSEIVAEFARQYSGTVTHIRHDPRLGASFNTQSLLKLAKGDYIARLDGDDYWLKHKLATQLDYLLNHPDCPVVYTNAITVDLNDRVTGIFNNVGDLRFDLGYLFRDGNFLNNSSPLLRRSLKYDWLALQGPLLDYQVHLLHATKGDPAHIGKPLVAYRVATPGSLVTTRSRYVRELYWQAIQSVPRDRLTSIDCASGLADFYCRVLFSSIRNQECSLAAKWWSPLRAASPYGSVNTVALVLLKFVRSAAKLFGGLIHTGAAGKYPRVRYRR